MENKFFILKPFNKDKNYNFHIEVKLSIDSEYHLNISYTILGDMNGLIIPDEENTKKRVIGLWESTCFEIFIKEPNSKNYYELNFSPEGHWNCFFFEKPGDYIKPFPLKNAPLIKANAFKRDEGFYKIEIGFNLKQIIKTFPSKEQVDLGISSIVILNNQATYWALNHFEDLPNFHDFKAFIPWQLRADTSN